MKNNPFSSIDPVLKFREIKNMVEKMNKAELIRVNEILENFPADRQLQLHRALVWYLKLGILKMLQ